jgi:Flp pilus assembly protein TadD
MKLQSKLLVSNVVALLALNAVAPSFAAVSNDTSNAQLNEIERQLNASAAPEPELLQQISKIIETHPGNGKAHFLAGRILERNGFSTLASQEFEKADKLSPQTADAMLETFLLKLEQDDAASAFDYIRYIAKRFPDDPSLALTRALLMESKGKTDLAEVFMKQALAGKDKRIGVATAIGQVRFRQGRPAEALSLAQYDLSKNPNYFRANYLAGQACTKLKRFKDGATYYGKAYQANASDDRFLTEYAGDLFRSGQYAAALQPALMNLALATVDKKLRQAKAQVAIAMKHTTEDQWVTAVKAVDKRIEGTIYQGRFHLALGDVFDAAGRRNLAEACYEKGIEQFPNMGRPYYRLARDVERDQDYEKAKGLYKKAFDLEPSDSQVAAGYLRFGMRYFNRKNDLAWQLKDALKKHQQQ